MSDRAFPLLITGLHHAAGASIVRDAWIDAVAAVLGDGDHLLSTTIACTRHPVRGFERHDLKEGKTARNAVVFSVKLSEDRKLVGHGERINALKQLLGEDPLQMLGELSQTMAEENAAAKQAVHDLVDAMLADPAKEDPLFDAIDAARVKATKILILNDGVRYLQKAADRGLL